MADDANSNGAENRFPLSEGFDFGTALGELASSDAITPGGRALTPGEIRLSESIFGDAIDYDQVRVFDGDYFPQNENGRMSVFDGEIFAPDAMYLDDYSIGESVDQSRFLHEMTHVWQDQSGVDMVAAIRAVREQNGGDYESGYDYELQSGKAFEDYNIETQAEIVSDYYFFRDTNFAPPGNRNASLDDYREALPFTPLTDEPAADVGDSSQPATIAAPPAPSPDAGPGNDAPILAEEDAPSPEPEASRSPPPSEAAPTARPLTPEDIENDPELAEDLRFLQEQDAQGGDNTSDVGSPTEEEDDDQENAGGGNERPNPVDDPVPGNGDVSVLTGRNVNAINTGSGDFDLAGVDGDILDLLDRNAPAINTGPGGFDMPVVTGDLSIILNRNAPAINTGFGDIDMPRVEGDLSDLLDRNGGRQSLETADVELASSTIGDEQLSDFDFSASLDDFAGFDLA